MGAFCPCEAASMSTPSGIVLHNSARTDALPTTAGAGVPTCAAVSASRPSGARRDGGCGADRAAAPAVAGVASPFAGGWPTGSGVPMRLSATMPTCTKTGGSLFSHTTRTDAPLQGLACHTYQLPSQLVSSKALCTGCFHQCTRTLQQPLHVERAIPVCAGLERAQRQYHRESAKAVPQRRLQHVHLPGGVVGVGVRSVQHKAHCRRRRVHLHALQLSRLSTCHNPLSVQVAEQPLFCACTLPGQRRCIFTAARALMASPPQRQPRHSGPAATRKYGPFAAH